MPIRDREKRNAYMRQYHAGPGGEKQRERVRRGNAERRRRTNEFVTELKRGSCLDCGGTFDPICMDFDHVRGVKAFGISDAARLGKTLAEVRAEVEKCDLICANCHRIRTRDRHRALESPARGGAVR